MSLSYDEKSPVPVHRVVNSAGVVVNDYGYREKLLLKEGIQVANNKVVDFRNKFWDPLQEIKF
jgi:methylated-DNA-protein-cysteine methyltransferase-like protein